MNSKNPAHAILIALGVLIISGMLVLYTKLDSLGQNQNPLTSSSSVSSAKALIPAMEEARVKAKSVVGPKPFTLKEGEAATITQTNSGSDIIMYVTLAALNSDWAVLGLHTGTWPVKVLQLKPGVKTFSYDGFIFTVHNMTGNEVSLSAEFQQN